MKKLFGILLLLCVFFGLAGCNKQIIDTTWKFNKAIVICGDEVVEYRIKSWNDYQNSDMIQITLPDGTVMLTHSSNVILIGE